MQISFAVSAAVALLEFGRRAAPELHPEAGSVVRPDYILEAAASLMVLSGNYAGGGGGRGAQLAAAVPALEATFFWLADKASGSRGGGAVDEKDLYRRLSWLEAAADALAALCGEPAAAAALRPGWRASVAEARQDSRSLLALSAARNAKLDAAVAAVCAAQEAPATPAASAAGVANGQAPSASAAAGQQPASGGSSMPARRPSRAAGRAAALRVRRRRRRRRRPLRQRSRPWLTCSRCIPKRQHVLCPLLSWEAPGRSAAAAACHMLRLPAGVLAL